MKAFKQVDFYGQAVLIVALTIVALVRNDKTYLFAYLVIGAWQFTSMLVHFANKWYSRPGGRRWYYNLVMIASLLLMGMCTIFPTLWTVTYLMIVAAPFMAIYYFSICFREVFYPAKRPLELI